MQDQRILSIIDRVLEEWLEKVDEVFSDKTIYKKLIFSKTSDLSQMMRTPRQCLYPGCEQYSIAHSHTIQRSGPLSVVAENGHVLMPTFNSVNGQLEIKEIGIRKYASTFPGFCSEHEGLFSEFENKKKLENPKDIALQIFRTLCREVVVRQISIENINKALDEYRMEEYTQFCKVLDIEFAKNGLDVKSSEIKFTLTSEDKRTLFYKKLSKHLVKILKDVQELARLSFNEFTSGGGELVYRVINIDCKIPVCIAGISNTTQKIRTKKRWKTNRDSTQNIYYLLNVLPSNESTQIILCTTRQFEGELNRYVKFITQSSFHVLSAIESWMIYGTDHWFLQPSVFFTIPQTHQEQIVNDIHQIKSVYHNYNLSIFDNIRGNLLANYSQLNEDERELLKEVYRVESTKMKLEQKSEKTGLTDFLKLVVGVKR